MEYINKGDFPISRYLTAKAIKRKIPLHGIFELTSRCNFNCKMCYVHGMEDAHSLKKEELSAKEWLSIAHEAKNAGLLFLLLTGGEAMLREDFAQIYEGLTQMGFRLVINTNGSLVTEEILDLFRKYPPARVNVSMYGASDATYESLCGCHSREKVVKAIRDIRDIGVSVRTTMTVTPYNCHDMQTVYNFSKTEGTLVEMTSYMFPPVRRDENSRGDNKARFTAEEAGRWMVEKERMSMTPEQFHERAVKVSNYVKHAEENAAQSDTIPERGNRIVCLAGRSSFWISWDGRMRACGLTIEPEADVRKLGFTGAWENIHQAAEQIRLPAQCSVCPRGELCRACAAMCYTETGHYDRRPEYVCSMSKAMVSVYNEEAGRDLQTSHMPEE